MSEQAVVPNMFTKARRSDAASYQAVPSKRGPEPIEFVDKKWLAGHGITYSSVHLLRLEADRKFPKRVYLSPGRVVWIKAEVDAHIARCIAARG